MPLLAHSALLWLTISFSSNKQADPTAARVDFVEFTFKDDFISRADMWRFKKQVYGKAAYIGPSALLSVRVGGSLARSWIVTLLHGSLQTPTHLPIRPPLPQQASTFTCWAFGRACGS